MTENGGVMTCQRCLQAAPRRVTSNRRARWSALAGPGLLAALGMVLLFGLFSIFVSWLSTVPSQFLFAVGHGH
ncbi:MAG: hypothetical protein ACRD1L_11025 [Terriglobales bacterium]